MCKWGKTETVRVKIPADLSCTGEAHWRDFKVDKCIAPIVKALQNGGIDMRGSCCGHGKRCGQIDLQDGRTILVVPPLDDQTECPVSSALSMMVTAVKEGAWTSSMIEEAEQILREKQE